LRVKFIVRRLAQAVPVAFLASIAIFLLLRLIPGDPADVLAGPDARPEVVQAIRQDLGLEQPLPVQYVIWLSHIVRGDLGRSALSKLPVADLIARRIPATLELAVAAMLLALAIALPTGIIAAIRQRGPADILISSLNGVLIAIPNFWFGILAIMLFALVLGWLPAGGRVELSRDPIQGLKFLCLPAITLALPTAVSLSRLVRTAMLEVLYEDFVRTARAKGLAGAHVVLRHALRNALIPVVTVLGLQFGRLLGGSVIVESVFGWPGVGRLMLDAIGTRDYVVVQAGLLLLVLVFILVNLLTDLLYGYLDPRIRPTSRPG
jgi:ABC-type dipeptide/oligopeptide/nickel transport system permease component